MPTVCALVDSLDIQQDRRQLVANTLQELGYLLDEPAGEALGAVTEAQLQNVRVKGAGLNVREILVRCQSQAIHPGQLTHDARYSKLCTMKGHMDKKVVDQMVRFFAAAIPPASQQLLSELYDLAKTSPLSNTKDILRKDEGLLFNGAFVAGTPCRSVLLIACENGATPVLCKFTAEQKAVDHEFSILKDLWQEPAVPGIVGPVKLLRANPKGRSRGQVAAPGSQCTMHRHIFAHH